MKNKFDFDEFLQFIKWERERINTHSEITSGSREESFVWMTKLMEECGELANEVFINKGLCRKAKLVKNDDALAKEFADIFIVLCIIADGLGIDHVKAIKAKMDIIKSRPL